MSLSDSIAAFSADLRSFAAQTADGINSLRRTVNSKPCIGRVLLLKNDMSLPKTINAYIIASKFSSNRPISLNSEQLSLLCTFASKFLTLTKACLLASATVFRESCEELVQQAAVISSEVGKLQSVTLDAVSLEVKLSRITFSTDCMSKQGTSYISCGTDLCS